jgi:membrane protease subunit HflC
MNRMPLIFGLALVVILSLQGFLFVVEEGRSAIVIQLGKVKREPVTDPGLHFKWPLIDSVEFFDARVLAWDGDAERIPVKDSKFVFVDTFARWRIVDPLRFYQAVRDEAGAQSRLDDILDGSVRDVVSTHYLLELVRTTDEPIESSRLGFQGEEGESLDELLFVEGEGKQGSGSSPLTSEVDLAGRRLEVRQQIFDICAHKLQELDLGIELVDLRVKRLDYTDEVREEVYRRMVSQQERIAERYRAQGQGKRAEIAGVTTQERRRIESESYRRAQEILGEAEAESTRIYADAYEQDPEFYRFLKSLETFQEVLGANDTLILSTESDLLRYLKTQR